MDNMQDLMNSAMTNIKESGYIAEQIEKQLKETVNGIIRDIFREYSDFGKKLKEEIEKQLDVDFSNLGLSGYSATLTTMIRQVITQKMDNDAKAEVDRFLDSIESDLIKPEMKITEIVEKIVELWKDDDPDLRHEGGEFSFHFIQRWPNSSVLNEHYAIYIDKDPDKEPKECEIELHYTADRQEIDDISINRKSMKENTFYTTRNFNVEGFLFRLYAAKSKIINDANQVEIEFDGENDDY